MTYAVAAWQKRNAPPEGFGKPDAIITLTFVGTRNSINTQLDQSIFAYVPDVNYHGQDTLELSLFVGGVLPALKRMVVVINSINASKSGRGGCLGKVFGAGDFMSRSKFSVTRRPASGTTKSAT